jgi:hypothetical protein
VGRRLSQCIAVEAVKLCDSAEIELSPSPYAVVGLTVQAGKGHVTESCYTRRLVHHRGVRLRCFHCRSIGG